MIEQFIIIQAKIEADKQEIKTNKQDSDDIIMNPT